jgi:hypothetical protein
MSIDLMRAMYIDTINLYLFPEKMKANPISEFKEAMVAKMLKMNKI